MSERYGTTLSARSDLMAQARYASDLGLPERRVRVLDLFEECLDAGLDLAEEIFEFAYGERIGKAYWAGWKANDFSGLYQFVRFLEIHSGKKRDIQYISRSPVLEAISVAHRSNPSWLKNNVGSEVDLGTESHPQLLAHWEICRGQAIQWMAEHVEFCGLLPSALRLNTEIERSKSGTQGRPSSLTLIMSEVRRLKGTDQAALTITEWSRKLDQWLQREHPAEQRTGPKAMRNSPELRNLLKELGLLIPPGSSRPK